MISKDDLQNWTENIVAHFRPNRVILFGSYARGQAHIESDIDLLIIMSYPDRPFKMAAKIRRLLRRVVGYVGGLDVMVRSPEELAERLAMGNSFLREIVIHGKTLYDAGKNDVSEVKKETLSNV
jgi:predicted nucleotidyltransferase